MTISELIELLQEIMEKEGDIEVAYTYNDGGYPMMGEEYAGGVEVRLTPYGKAVVICRGRMKYRMKYRLKDRELQRKLDALSNGDFSRQLASNKKRIFAELNF